MTPRVDDLRDDVRIRALARLRQMPAGTAILHGDLPGNVLMGAPGPMAIDRRSLA
jgi:hypothetical protein